MWRSSIGAGRSIERSRRCASPPAHWASCSGAASAATRRRRPRRRDADMGNATTHASPARIAVLTSRAFSRMAFQCGHLEAQDVLADCGEVDLIELEAEPGFPRRQQWIRRLMYRDVTRRLAYANPGLKPVRLNAEYDAL